MDRRTFLTASAIARAGHSGYAFQMCVVPNVSVAGPTVFPFEDLSNGWSTDRTSEALA